MECKIDKLPVQVPTHSFFYFIKTVIKNKPYQECLQGTNSWKCAGPLANTFCPNRRFPSSDNITFPSGMSMPECYEFMKDLNNNNSLDEHFEKVFNRARTKFSKDAMFNSYAKKVIEYKTCMSDIVKKVEKCYSILEGSCNTTTTRAIKAIRLRVKTAQEMLDKDEDMMLVLMFRDPRGIVASRFKAHFVSANSNKNKLTEAKMICQRMAEDYKVYSELIARSKYDGRVLMLRYENVVKDPVNAAKRVYWNLLGDKIPANVSTWLSSSVTARDDNGIMGTKRKNGTSTANKWQRSLTQQEITDITEYCKPILKRLKYPVDV